MKRLLMVAALSMSCSLLAACDPEKVVQHLPTPPERLVCEAAGARPAIAPEHTIDWNSVVTVDQARAEHDKYVISIRNREGVITGYLVSIEGKLFTCYTNMEWRRSFEGRLPKQ